MNERLRLFAAAIGDPHRFRVGDTEVEVPVSYTHLDVYKRQSLPSPSVS